MLAHAIPIPVSTLFVRSPRGAIILATGGARQIYSQPTYPEMAIGDGITLAWESGAVVADL